MSIVNQAVLDALKTFDLSEEECRAYCALLGSGTLTVTEVSDVAEISRTKTYGILEGLEEKGMVIAHPGRPVVYRAVPPETALGMIIERRKESLLEDVKRMENTKEYTLEELTSLYETGVKYIRPEYPVWVLKGRKAVQQHLAESLRGVRESIISICAPMCIPILAEVLIESLRAAHKRGVKLQMVVPITMDNLDHIKILSSVCELRHIDTAYARFYVFDEIKSLIMTGVMEKPGYEMGILSKNKEKAEMFKHFFVLAWESAEPFSKRMAKLKTET